MASLMDMDRDWQRHLRALFRVLAASLVLAVALGAAHERPEVVVILGPPPRAATTAPSARAPTPVAAPVQAPRSRPAPTGTVLPRSAHHVLVQIGRFSPLHPPDLRLFQPGPSLYLAYLRILC